MIGVIIQARSRSTRFLRKIYEPIIEDKYTLQMVLEGVKQAIIPHKIVLAMPVYDRQGFFLRSLKNEFAIYTDHRFYTYFGHADDLVDRYFTAANQHGLTTIVRITAYCPLIQGDLIDDMLTEYFKIGGNCYMGNVGVSPKPYCDGLDIEIFPYYMLADTMRSCKDPAQREHATQYIYQSGKYKVVPYLNLPPHRTVTMKHPNISFDTPEDLILIKKIAQHYDLDEDNLNEALDAVDA